MSSSYEFEFSEPAASRCECCGGRTTRLTRFVCRDGDAFCVYYAAYSNNHAEREIDMLFSLGEWGEESSPSDRIAFYCKVRPTEDSYEVMLHDGESSPWGTSQIVGPKLSRAAALSHPLKQTAFEVLDEAFVRDRSLQGYLHRVACGDPSVPLEHSFGLPDELFALGDSLAERAKATKNFASLDGERFFLRCLIPVPVEHYGAWTIGVWVEVSKADSDAVDAAWDSPEAWARLQFSGRIANDGTELGLPIEVGTAVAVHGPNPDHPPYVLSASHADLANLILQTWSRDSFEAYATAQGML